MRIVRYRLEITDYQQLQPLWPGHILSLGVCRTDSRGNELPIEQWGIDMWCIDNSDQRGDKSIPLLGVWVVGTGNPIPAALTEADAMFHGTVDMRAEHMGAWHVFSAIVGHAPETPAPMGEVESYSDIVDKIKQRHAGRQQQ